MKRYQTEKRDDTVFTGGVVFTPSFWDCGCEGNFIRHVSIKDCTICGASRDTQVDSDVGSVREILSNLGFKEGIDFIFEGD